MDTCRYDWWSSAPLVWGPFAIGRWLSPPPSVQLRWKRQSYLPCWQNSILRMRSRTFYFKFPRAARSAAGKMIAISNHSKTFILAVEVRSINMPPLVFCFFSLPQNLPGRGMSDIKFTLCGLMTKICSPGNFKISLNCQWFCTFLSWTNRSSGRLLKSLSVVSKRY